MNRFLNSFIPVASLIAGVGLTLSVGATVFRPGVDVQESIDTFEQMSDREQQQMRRYAREYATEEDLRKLREKHEAVSRDPGLQAKLATLNQWLQSVDKETEYALRPSGAFAENWVQIVEERFHRDANQEPLIRIYLGEPPDGIYMTVTEEQYYTFVDQIVSDRPGWIQADLNDYESRTAAMLAKCNYISLGLFGGEGFDDLQNMEQAIYEAYKAIFRDLLIDSGEHMTDRETENRRILTQWLGENRRQAPVWNLVWKVFYSGMIHFGNRLAAENPPPGQDALLAALEGLSREEQLELFSDTGAARKQLELIALRETTNERVRELLAAYEERIQKLNQALRRKRTYSPRASGPRRGR